jgi:hypothetical protein
VYGITRETDGSFMIEDSSMSVKENSNTTARERRGFGNC